MFKSTAIRFVKGGLSGFASGALLQPLNVIKTSMQVSPIKKDGVKTGERRNLSFMQATSTIYHSEGMRGFMRGLAPSLIKNVVTSGTFFSMLYYFEESLKKLKML
jgi:hypothetical protein